MTNRRYAVLFLFITGVLAALVFLSGRMISFRDVMNPEDYLASLSESDTFGVQHSMRVEPEILVIGDSHAYTAINYNLLAQLLGTESIGSCTLGGSYLETILIVLKQYETLGALPQTVIYTTSPRQFWVDENKTRQLAQHRVHIFASGYGDMVNSVQNFLAYLSGKKLKEHAFERLTEKERLAESAIESLDDAVIQKDLDHTKDKYLDIWKGRVDNCEYDKDVPKLLNELCQLIQRNHVNLYVVHIPESPWLESLYPEWITREYHAILHQLDTCARRVYIYSRTRPGLSNHHFVNRKLDPDYDYSQWNSPDFHFVDGIFDVDHMNRVGASRFTAVMGRDIAEDMRDQAARKQ